MMPDDETATGFTYTLVPQDPVDAATCEYKVTTKRTLTISELEVLDSVEYSR